MPRSRPVSRSLAIVKTRASNHDPVMRQFSIGPDGISLEAAAIPEETQDRVG
jgi:hypothetical protein